MSDTFYTAWEAKERAEQNVQTSIEEEREIVKENIDIAVFAGKFFIIEPTLSDENNKFFRDLGYRVLYQDTGVEIRWDHPLVEPNEKEEIEVESIL